MDLAPGFTKICQHFRRIFIFSFNRGNLTLDPGELCHRTRDHHDEQEKPHQTRVCQRKSQGVSIRSPVFEGSNNTQASPGKSLRDLGVEITKPGRKTSHTPAHQQIHHRHPLPQHARQRRWRQRRYDDSTGRYRGPYCTLMYLQIKSSCDGRYSIEYTLWNIHFGLDRALSLARSCRARTSRG